MTGKGAAVITLAERRGVFAGYLPLFLSVLRENYEVVFLHHGGRMSLSDDIL